MEKTREQLEKEEVDRDMQKIWKNSGYERPATPDLLRRVIDRFWLDLTEMRKMDEDQK